MAKRKAKKKSDGISEKGPNGKPTNSRLHYEMVDSVPDTARDRREHKKALMALGLSEEEAESVS